MEDTAIIAELEETGEEQRVVEWRFEELVRAGYPSELALTLALCRDVDLHLAVDLPGRGCPPETALRILL